MEFKNNLLNTINFYVPFNPTYGYYYTCRPEINGMNANQNQNQRYECRVAFKINGIYACGHRPGYKAYKGFKSTV